MLPLNTVAVSYWLVQSPTILLEKDNIVMSYLAKYAEVLYNNRIAKKKVCFPSTCAFSGRTDTFLSKLVTQTAFFKVHKLFREEHTGGQSDKKLIDKKSWGWIHQFLAWKSKPSVPKRRFLGRTFCSLERGGGTTPSGGLRPPEPRLRRFFRFWA